jgi:hypothetical protein
MYDFTSTIKKIQALEKKANHAQNIEETYAASAALHQIFVTVEKELAEQEETAHYLWMQKIMKV